MSAIMDKLFVECRNCGCNYNFNYKIITSNSLWNYDDPNASLSGIFVAKIICNNCGLEYILDDTMEQIVK